MVDDLKEDLLINKLFTPNNRHRRHLRSVVVYESESNHGKSGKWVGLKSSSIHNDNTCTKNVLRCKNGRERVREREREKEGERRGEFILSEHM